MTLLAHSIAVNSDDDVEPALRRAAGGVTSGARLVEWRIDGLGERPGATASAEALVRESPAPCIVTCRSVDEGGRYGGGDEARGPLLEALVLGDRPPRSLALAGGASLRHPALSRRFAGALETGRHGRDLHTSLILSVHDFDRRPPDLLQRIEAMVAEPACAVVKVAWRARSVRDNLEIIDLLGERQRPMIALCLGPFGLMSRVLAPKFGGLLTYATDRPGEETAPGQPTIDELHNVYGFGRIGAQTRVYGVAGWPVEYSLSPAIHNAGFRAVDHAGVYLPLPIPEEYEHFKATMGSLVDHEGLGFRGASVTAPHKENLLRFVGERGGGIDESARSVGAANTLAVLDDGSIECRNTDAPAALATLGAQLGLEPQTLGGLRVAVLGAGGVARAVVAGMSRAGAEVVVFNRSAERAQALADQFNGRSTSSGAAARVVCGRPDALGGGGFDVFVNCTPLGMAGGPAPAKSPLPDDVPLSGEVTVFDTVYTPRRTPLIARAEAAGARTIRGLDMFLRQAAMQFQWWTGKEAPREVLEEAISD